MKKNIFEDYIQNKKEEMIENLQKLIQIPSVYEKSEDKIKPFGKNANEALEYMLNLGKKLGFRTKNVDGYCGYIEFGEGEELLGIIGHLDVVPTGEGWNYPPFSATIQENKIYGRGAIDDKGPVISALYAMKAVMDNVKINKRVRLILGLNEENSWKCINYYKEHEEHPTIGFSPDADFPCIYAEKSILTHKISMPYKMENKKIAIIKIDCNNNPNNVVPRICKVDLKIDKIDIDELTSKTEEIIKKYNFNIEISKLSENTIRLTSKGLEAHAAHPDLGINAISNLIIVLNEILKKYNEEEFHIRHALTVEGVMIYFAEQMGYNEDFWGLVGLLHDVDFEKYPDEHCKKAPELLKEINASDEMVHAICSHGYGSCSDIKPEHAMEKVLYAVDELTGLIWAAAKMRPSKSTKDMEVSSLKKKFKDKKFAAGCSRDVISKGAEVLEMSLEELFEKTILAMRSCEDIVEEELKEVCK